MMPRIHPTYLILAELYCIIKGSNKNIFKNPTEFTISSNLTKLKYNEVSHPYHNAGYFIMLPV